MVRGATTEFVHATKGAAQVNPATQFLPFRAHSDTRTRKKLPGGGGAGDASFTVTVLTLPSPGSLAVAPPGATNAAPPILVGQKALPTFSDALAQVRRCVWRQMAFCLSAEDADKRKLPAGLFEHLGELLAMPPESG